MSALYADSSALGRVYLGDEPGWIELESLLFGADAFVATSELSSVELAGAAKGAERAGRIVSADVLLTTVEADLRGQIQLIRLDPENVLPQARELVLGYRLRTLDAIHLAVALEFRASEEDDVGFVTRDADQAAAADALGFALL